MQDLIVLIAFLLIFCRPSFSELKLPANDAKYGHNRLCPRNTALAIPSLLASITILGFHPQGADALTSPSKSNQASIRQEFSTQSRGWDLARQKRTVAIAELQKKGIISINTDDVGNQFLSLPWIPDKSVPYKSLSVKQRLLNEMCAGAFGEISKDTLLHWVDTLKTRKQAAKKQVDQSGTSANETNAIQASSLSFAGIKSLYAGFPIVAMVSIPQGGAFFLVKKGLLELQSQFLPGTPEAISQIIPIMVGVMAYWLFRTPAEVIKTQVQTAQQPNFKVALEEAIDKNPANLWRYYSIMLSLDIPFQIVNFILFGFVSDAVLKAGIETSILTRLFCGISCGMVAAGLTCPLDVGKTRIISRDKQRVQREAELERLYAVEDANNANTTVRAKEKTNNMVQELTQIATNEGVATLFLGLRQRLLYTGLANGIRLAAYGTSRMDLMMRSLDDL